MANRPVFLLEIGLRQMGITAARFATSAEMSASEFSKILTSQDNATAAQKEAIAEAIKAHGLRLDINNAFTAINLREPGTLILSSSRKLPPRVEASIAADIKKLKQELASYKAQEPERLRALAEATAKKFFRP